VPFKPQAKRPKQLAATLALMGVLVAAPATAHETTWEECKSRCDFALEIGLKRAKEFLVAWLKEEEKTERAVDKIAAVDAALESQKAGCKALCTLDAMAAAGEK